MTAFTNGTGGTLTGITTVEDWTFALINFLRIQQGNSAKNPSNLKYLNVTTNTDGALSGTFSCPCTVVAGTAGALSITAASYLTGVTYTAPSGGDSTATNEVQALIDAVRRQKALELDTTKNTGNANYLSLSVTMGATGVGSNNATVNLGFSGLPGDMTQAANGSLTVEGRTYLS
ncbi:hypothetical protein QUA41_30725 [Microcoleus sp. Pol11C1]|uniref:hypothetical protein n=1 Tax=unclassified Microcoleus TaxID=2642155 RepID=UPI002FCECC0D